MNTQHLTRRRFVHAIAAGAAAISHGSFGMQRSGNGFTLVTFGDSILDCARYNDRGIHPAQLIVRNDDRLFPAYKGRDLSSIATLGPVRLEHRAVDGGRVGDLPGQARGLRVNTPAVVLITVGGNDLLGGLAADTGDGIERFASRSDSHMPPPSTVRHRAIR